jgi:hypothetical protein
MKLEDGAADRSRMEGDEYGEVVVSTQSGTGIRPTLGIGRALLVNNEIRSKA